MNLIHLKNRIEIRNDEGVLHRDDGPAIIFDNKSEHWYSNGKPHRADGPAITNYNDKSEVMYEWWLNGKLHRSDGPAIINEDHTVEYWIDGKEIPEDEYNNQRFIKWVKMNSR